MASNFPHSSLPGLRYGGTRNYVYDTGRSERLHVLVIDHENGPWEVIRCKTEAQARYLAGLVEQLETLREDVRVAIEDILLLDSPEGDSPRNIAANLRRAVGSNPAEKPS